MPERRYTIARLTLIRGIPGAGKSTLAKQMLDKGLVDKHFEADMWMIGDDGVYRFRPEILARNHQMCQRKTYEALVDGYRVVVSNTFVFLEHIAPYIEFGYNVDIIELKTSYGSIHNVPEEKVKAMLHNMERITSDWVKQFIPTQVKLINEVTFL